MVEFGILGPLRLATGVGDVDIGARKRRGLVARLLVDANRVVPTDRLVDDLWADASPGAGATVQTYVSRLRKLIGSDRVVTRSPGYLLVVESGELDADRFESLVARARDRSVSPDDAIALLDEAERLWRGPALAEFAGSAWARPMAERLERRRTDAVGDRAEALLRAGRAREATGELEALVECHPLDERLWQLLILAHYRCGRQADALRVYQRARSTLIEELGVEPGPALRGIEGAVLSHDPSLDAAAAPSRPASVDGAVAPVADDALPRSDLSWVPPALAGMVGRDLAMDRLLGATDAAAAGAGQLVLVEGEPGAGKTRLLAEVAVRADAQGCLVLYGRCDEDASVPYQPFVTALEPPLRTARPDLGSLAADLAVLFPDLGGEVAAPPTPALDPESRRYRLFEAINRVLSELARERTVVLLVDDLQWADGAVLALLRHVARTLATRRLLVVAAFRSETADPGNALQANLLHLRRHLPAVDVSVSRLTDHDIDQLLSQWMGDDRQAERALLARRLRRETSGNALFVTEVVRDLFPRDGEAPGNDGDLPLPATVADIVATRVAQLAPATQRFLTAASVVGLAFDVTVAAEVASLDDDEAMDALDEAIDRGLVAETAAGRMAFSHGLVRRALYARLASPRRVRSHLAVARALQRRDPDLANVEGVARHFGAGAGRPGTSAAEDAEAVRDAIRYARLAGDRAMAQLAYETAIDHYRRALELLTRGEDQPDARERCDVLLTLARALNQDGDLEEAKERLLEATAIATALDELSVVAQAALAFGGVLQAGADISDPRGIALMHRAIDALPPGDSAERALLLGRLAQAEYWVQPRRGRAARCSEAEAIAHRLDDQRTLATVLVNRYWALEGPDEVDARLQLTADVEQIATDLGDPELALQAGKCRLHVLLSVDAWGEALALAEQLRRRARELRQPEYQRLALSFDAVLAANAGRYDEAERLAQRARDLLVHLGKREHAVVVHTLQLLPWRWLQSRLGEQIHRLARFVEHEPGRPVWRALVAWAHAEGGDPGQAAGQLEQLDLARYLDSEHAFDFWLVAVPSAVAVTRLGDTGAAARLYHALRPYAGRNAFVGQIAFLGCIDHHLGALALMLGRDEAASHLRRAVDRYRAMGAAVYAEKASGLLATADPARAGQE
jgi:DNA-binding SARP family transcriptional activator